MRLPTVDEWIADLRENGDKQGKDFLSSEKGDCCLGRLCILAGVSFDTSNVHTNGKFDVKVFDFPQEVQKTGERGYFAYPAPAFMYKYGMNEFGFPLKLGHSQHHVGSLSEMNDKDRSFREIADVLQDWYDKGFIHDPSDEPAIPTRRVG